MGGVQWGTLGEWASGFAAVAAVGVAYWLSRRTDRREAAGEAAQVIVYGWMGDKLGMPSRELYRAEIRNYSQGVLAPVCVETTWDVFAHSAEVLAPLSPLDAEASGTTTCVLLHHIKPGTEDGLVRLRAPTGTTRAPRTRLYWRDRHGGWWSTDGAGPPRRLRPDQVPAIARRHAGDV